jgi:HSP20 family protein
MFALTPWLRKRETEFPVTKMHEEFNTLFNRFFGNWPMLFEPPTEMERYWNLEMKETEKEFLVRAEAPGFEPGEFTLEIVENVLLLKAEHTHEVEKKEKEVEFTERRNLHYERRVPLPAAVCAEKVEATYRNGVLEVRLPKAEEAKKFRIPVK